MTINSRHHALSPKEWQSLKLQKVTQLTQHIYTYRFEYNDKQDDSGCKTGEYIAVRAVLDNQECIRYYSPISSVHDNHIDLVIKVDDKGGKMSYHLRDMKIGDTLDFKGPISGFQYQPNAVNHIGLIAGGTGIAPMLQILREIVTHREYDQTKVTLIYGSPSRSEFVFKDELDRLVADHQIEVVYAVDWLQEEEKELWDGFVGFVNQDMIKNCMPPPSSEDLKSMIVFCGPPVMSNSVERMLIELGYPKECYYKYG